MRLEDVLRAMEPPEFERFCRRQGVQVDSRKRLSSAAQASRQLADLARRTDLRGFPEPVRAAAHWLATHPEGRTRKELGGGVLPLIQAKLVYTRPDRLELLAMPACYRARLAPFPGEVRTSARVLLSLASDEVLRRLGSALYGRQAAGPLALIAAELLIRLEDPSQVMQTIADLSPKQQRLLEAIEARGGQMETDELLTLERSAIRYQALGADLPPRSASFVLHRQGLLMPRASGVWVIPAEVIQCVGAERRNVEQAKRRELLARVATDDELNPARAQLAVDPMPAAMAVVAALQRAEAWPSDSRAIRRSALRRAATDAGCALEAAEFLAVLMRALGADICRAHLQALPRFLLEAWRTGGSWDEARLDCDVHRSPDLQSVVTPTVMLREVLITLLEAMPKGRFAPEREVCGAVVRDLRAAGSTRLLERANTARSKAFHSAPEEVLAGIVRSLTVLGVLDRGMVEQRSVFRLSYAGRDMLCGQHGFPSMKSEWPRPLSFQPGSATAVSELLAAARFGSLIPATQGLALVLDEATIRRCFANGQKESTIRERLSNLLGTLPSPVEALLNRACRELPHVTWAPVAAFVRVEDADLRARIRAHPGASQLLLPDEVGQGVLVRAGVERAKLRKWLIELGVTLSDEVPGAADSRG